MNKILTLAATALVAVGLIAGTAGPASAETLTRNGAKTVTITPSTAGVPAGAKVVTKTITVKKGKKIKAKNKSKYKAKKGTYKVTSTVRYQTKVRKSITEPIITATCTITSTDAPSVEAGHWVDGYWTDNGYYDDYGLWHGSRYWTDGYWVDGNEGEYGINYTGTCTDWYWINGGIKTITWNTGWSTTEYLTEGSLNYTAGDSMFITNSDYPTVLPYYTTWGSTKTVTSTRTVVVR